MILAAVLIVAWILWIRFVNPASERDKFFVTLAASVVCISLVWSFSGFPSIGVGLMSLIMCSAVFQRGLDWYRSIQVRDC